MKLKDRKIMCIVKESFSLSCLEFTQDYLIQYFPSSEYILAKG